MPRYKKEDKVQITFTKYAIRKRRKNNKTIYIKEDTRKIPSKKFKFSNTKEVRKACKFRKYKDDKDRKREEWEVQIRNNI